jgi:molecular chaperone GrpE
MEIPIEIEDSKNEHPLEEAEESQPTEQVVDIGPSESEPEPETLKAENPYLDQLQRLKAEFDNYRKRSDKEKQEFYAFAKGRVFQTLLPVLDDLDRMAQHGKGPEDPLATGIELIRQKMKAILLSEGLEEINPEGTPFDPAFHEAIGLIDADLRQDGLVMEELERGYMLQGRLLRPSRVRVGKFKEN